MAAANRARENQPHRSIHDAYVAQGARHYYEHAGADYRNPHEPIIIELVRRVLNAWPIDVSNTLDLAAGSGEVTLALREAANGPIKISAIDPFTAEAYFHRTGTACERLTFEEIAGGALVGQVYSLIVCSFAMHLADASRLAALCWRLTEISPQLLILTPHKRPILKPEWGWILTHEILHDRVRARLYVRHQPNAVGAV